MFIPIGDTPNPRRFTPIVNYALIAANVLVYLLISLPLSISQPEASDPAIEQYVRTLLPTLPHGVDVRAFIAQITNYDLFVFEHGYKPGAAELSDLFSSMFLHGGFMHLAGNMLFLWIYGDNCEHRLGRLPYLVTYLVSGVCATWGFAVFAGPSMTPLVGASGAISGVLGLYFLMFPRNKVKVFIALFPFFFNVVLLPARLVLGVYLILDNLLPFIIGAQSSVAYGAHLGGFVAGFATAAVGERFAWQWPRGARRPASPRRGQSDEPGSALPALRAALDDGDAKASVALFERLSRDDLSRLPPSECIELAEHLAAAGQVIAAGGLLRACLGRAREVSPPDVARVYLALGLMRLAQEQPTAAYQHLLSVFDHSPEPETAARAKAALQTIDVYRRPS